MTTCANASPNVGTFYGIKNSGLGTPVGIIITPEAYTMTAANFLLNAQHIIGVKAKNEFPVRIKEFIDNSTEATYHDFGNETREVTRQGKYRFTVSALVNSCVKKELMKFRNYPGNVFFVYSNNVILGTTDDSGTTVRGLTMSMINIEKQEMPIADGSVVPMVDIVIDLDDEKELSLYSFQGTMSWNVKKLNGLTPVTIIQYGAASATSVIVDVYSDCNDGCELPIEGLVTADFAISGAGSLTSATESETVAGRYTLVTVGATDSTVIALVTAASISLTLFPVICTVPATIDVT
jgi:hypothetical protein